MSQFYPLPSLIDEPFNKPLKSFHATDGIVLDAELWNLTQDYHQRRQNLHHQTFYKPGIVCGFGIKLRSSSKVEIQPGIAIDLYGNPIILTETKHTVVSEVNNTDKPIYKLIYIEHREKKRNDGDNSDGKSPQIVEGVCMLGVQTNELKEHQLELCRIKLEPKEQVNLKPTRKIFEPESNTLDFRFRQQAAIRAEKIVRIAQLQHDKQTELNYLKYLQEATTALYPQLDVIETIDSVTWQTNNLENYQLLYHKVNSEKPQIISNTNEETALKNYLKKGGVLWLDSPERDTFDYIRQEIRRLGYNPKKIPGKSDPLLRKPFLFSGDLQEGLAKPIDIYLDLDDGVVLVKGELSSLWLEDKTPRHTIRAAQELGINILHYAWQRHVLIYECQRRFCGD